MKRYHPRGASRKSAAGLPDGGPDLFDWAATRPAFDASPQKRAIWCICAGADPEPDGAPAGRVRSDMAVCQPSPVRGQAHV
jgi:hypothetical protein